MAVELFDNMIIILRDNSNKDRVIYIRMTYDMPNSFWGCI